jgi:hypothetical protein
MSFDLSVWHCEKWIGREEAGHVHVKLCQEWPYLTGSSPRVEAFYKELTDRWPEIDTIALERIDDVDLCPWSCALSHSGMAVVLACVWSKADDVADYVTKLAEKHKLVLFDPQANRVILPPHLEQKGRSSRS